MRTLAVLVASTAIAIGGNARAAGGGIGAPQAPAVGQGQMLPAPRYILPPGFGYPYPSPLVYPVPRAEARVPETELRTPSAVSESASAQPGPASGAESPLSAAPPARKPYEQRMREAARAREEMRQRQIRARRDALYDYYFRQRIRPRF